ncbi:hypothetical protein ADUPG1_005024, partial [Aduncisulcus paluster]
MQEKKEKGKDEEEEEKRVEAKAAAFGFSFSSEVEHVPKDIRTPDFFEITHSELGDFLGVPLVSEISWSAILQFQFFLGFQNGKISGPAMAGNISKGAYGYGGVSGKWIGIPVPTPEAIEMHSKGEGLNAEQELSYAWTVPIEEDVITVGDIPSEEDRGTDRDKNTLILVDPAEDARYALTIPNVRPGRWHASKLSRDGTNGECQLLHES